VAYQRLTMDEWNIQQYTCSGWETVCTDLSAHAAFMTKREYQANQPGYSVRIKSGRFKRSDHTASALAGFEREAHAGRQAGYLWRANKRRLRLAMKLAMEIAFHYADQRMAQPNFIGPMYIGR
jgi:hypothetical protein